ENASFSQFKARLAERGVQLFDPATLIRTKTSTSISPLYLKADTHWLPQTMELVAQELAKKIKAGASGRTSSNNIEEKKISGLGDVARMLKLPERQTSQYVEEISIHQVTTGNTMWRPSKNADVLLLGDSFSNVFSQ